MRKLVILGSLLLVASLTQAATVKGKINDSKSGEAVEFANVVIKKSQSTEIVGAATSDENGVFVVDRLPAANYDLEISFVGYMTYTLALQLKLDETKTLAIKLKPDSKLLQEVEVTGQASQMRFDIDKKVFNVDANVASAGASASEVLENIPSVEVDNEGNISLRNNSSVEIWINGKPAGLTEDNRAQILEQMPAGTIESIEVITNPSAKFNPEGSAGIINLVLKKERKAGYYGSVSAGGNYQLKGLPGGNVSANFNYNSSKIDAYANLGYRYRNFFNSKEIYRESFSRTEPIDTTRQNQNSLSRREGGGIFGRAGFDWHINDKNTLGVSAMIFTNNNWMTDSTHYDVSRMQPAIDTALFTHQSNTKADRLGYHLSLDYKFEIDQKGSELTSSVTFGQFSNNQKANYWQTVQKGKATEYQQQQFNGGKNSNLEAKIDYVQKFGDNMKLEAGALYSISDRLSSSETDDFKKLENKFLQSAYNDFRYSEQIAALYTTFGAKFGQFSFQAGLRGEYTFVKVGSREAAGLEYEYNYKNYPQLFPTLFLSYAFPNNHELQLNYTRRIRRPRGRQLQSFVNLTDSTNISYGNPNLNPEFNNVMELNYIKNWDKHIISASAFCQYQTDIIQRVQFQSDNNPKVMENTFDNVASSLSVGVELVAKNSIGKWLNLTTTLSYFYQKMDSVHYKGKLLQLPSEGHSFSARLMANFIFGKGFSGQLTGNYRSPFVIAQGKTSHNYGIDLGIRKSFLNKTLNLSLTVRNVLNSRNWKTTTWGENFYQNSNNHMYGPNFALSLTYNFGNMKGKKRPQNNGGQGEGGEDFGGGDFFE